jgi:hypothetical protein
MMLSFVTKLVHYIMWKQGHPAVAFFCKDNKVRAEGMRRVIRDFRADEAVSSYGELKWRGDVEAE